MYINRWLFFLVLIMQLMNVYFSLPFSFISIRFIHKSCRWKCFKLSSQQTPCFFLSLLFRDFKYWDFGTLIDVKCQISEFIHQQLMKYANDVGITLTESRKWLYNTTLDIAVQYITKQNYNSWIEPENSFITFVNWKLFERKSPPP